MKKQQFSFDSECLELARHFYPDYSDEWLALLAQSFQDAAEDFVPELRSDLAALLADVQSGSARNGAAAAAGVESTATLTRDAHETPAREPIDVKAAAERAIAYLTSEEGRAELKQRSEENEAFFKWLRKATRPTPEQLHRPFDI